jgi:hypothetical protein
LPEGIALSQFGNMRLEFRAVQVFTPHSVVPFMQGYTMVINYPSRVDGALEVFIPFMAV